MYYQKKKWRLNFKVKFKKFSSLAYVPTKTTPGSACFDVYSIRDVLLGPGVTKTVELNLGFQFSKKYVCRNYSISGLSLQLLSLGGGEATFHWFLPIFSCRMLRLRKDIELER